MTILEQPQTIKTLGTITFSTCGETRQPLFRMPPVCWPVPAKSASTRRWAMRANRVSGLRII